MRWLGRWFGPKRERAQVVFYTRAGCHLCLEVAPVLAKYERQFHFALDVVDVDSTPELAARFGLIVPVVAINGRVRFRGRVNEVLLRRLLAGFARPATPTDPSQDGGASLGPS